MNKVIPISAIIVTVAIIAIFTINFEQSNTMEVEDTMDRELRPDEELTPEIQEKLDEIEKINLENEYNPKPREWITSGPFQIDRSEYVLGEKIFLIIGGLQENEKGQVAFYRPQNNTHSTIYFTIPFDGSDKSVFNYYLQPQLSVQKGLCTAEEFIGTWTIVFRGTNYENLQFKITDQILPGDEGDFEPVC
ncbi:hypothetical protein [Nitrosopumilus sp.]|uniref:hypothetical protein n=1 Tax=Nitrosopumilus sp. TaxID=2024843 RepID=UPI003D12E2B2